MDDAMKHTGVELGDYLEILKRRKKQLMIPFVAILLASVLVALLIPPVYRSEGTILVQREEVSGDIVETTVTGYAQERIESIRQRILAREKLLKIAADVGLYADKLKQGLEHEVVQDMRDAIFIEMVDVEASNPGAGRQTVITVAFTIAFEASEPAIAQKVTTALANLFLEENRRQREDQSSQVAAFLGAEAEKLRLTIRELDQKIADFKQKRSKELPEQLAINQRFFEETEKKLAEIESDIRSARNEKKEMEAQLVVTDPHIPLRDDTGTRVNTPAERLVQARFDLTKAKQKYSAVHPDIQRLEAEVKSLERELVNSDPRQRLSDAGRLMETPTNPEYTQIKSKIDTMSVEITASQESKRKYEAKLEEYRQRIYSTPIVERDYGFLNRDYESARKTYADIKEKQLQAKLGIQLEKEQKAGTFALVEPPNLPVEPDRPNRLGIFLIGFIFAFSGGMLSAFVAEYSDRSVRGVRGIIDVLNAPPIATIPFIEPQT